MQPRKIQGRGTQRTPDYCSAKMGVWNEINEKSPEYMKEKTPKQGISRRNIVQEKKE